MKTPHDLPPPPVTRSFYLRRFTLRTEGKFLVLNITEIDAIESAGNYVAIQTGKETYILRQTLSALEKQLDPSKFLRISRSAIVNLERVKELRPMFHGQYVITLHSGKRVTMTRKLRDVTQALMFS